MTFAYDLCTLAGGHPQLPQEIEHHGNLEHTECVAIHGS